MRQIETLAKLFASYQIYPKECYKTGTPLKVFQQKFPNRNYYIEGIEEILSFQSECSVKKGADLPWWGEHYFTDLVGFRIMVVGPQSKAPDAGSIVFYMNLLDYVDCKSGYEDYMELLDTNWRFPYHNWSKLCNQFHSWGIDPKFLYVTDGAKVYKEGLKVEIDTERSKKLLYEEIELCNPDLIILLGAAPLKLLRDDMTYSSVVERKEYITIKNYRAVVSPFPSGNGLSQNNFHERLANATYLIREAFGLF